VRRSFWESLFLFASNRELLSLFVPHFIPLFTQLFIDQTLWAIGQDEADIRFFASSFFFSLLQLLLAEHTGLNTDHRLAPAAPAADAISFPAPNEW
jgi:hypothetical protein